MLGQLTPVNVAVQATAEILSKRTSITSRQELITTREYVANTTTRKLKTVVTRAKQQTNHASLEDGLAKQTTLKPNLDLQVSLSTVSLEP